jgi:hypothetical protein
MEIQLTFTDPLWVSQNTLPCFIELDFGDGEAFKSKGFGVSLKKDTKKRVKLLQQLPVNGATKALKAVTNVITGLTVALALATPFLSAALGELTRMINGLQLVLYFPLMNVFPPSNLGVLHNVVMLILTFEMIPGDLY